MKKKLWPIVSLFFVLLVACSPTVPESEYLAAQDQISMLQDQISTLQDDIAAYQSELEAAESELEDTQTDLDTVTLEWEDTEQALADAESQVISMTVELETISEDMVVLQTDYDELQTSYDEMSDDYYALKTDNRMLKADLGQYVCEESITDMEYDNILDVSTILSGWVARQSWSERVQGSYRDTIWGNTDTKIHSIRFISSEDSQPYVDHFLVYFDEFGFEEGVFWLSRQCWLDRE